METIALIDREHLIIEKLGLKRLNLEAGLFGLLSESAIEVINENERLAASNVIYLMLNQNEPINYLQMLRSDDYHILIEGGPADYYLFYTDGTTARCTLGRDIARGEVLVVPAPGGTAKAIVLHDEAEYLLAASVVTPAWTPTRVEIGGDDSFVKKFLDSSVWATETKIRTLLGPNYGKVIGGKTNNLDLEIDDQDQIIFLGMQLSLGQAAKEIERFATSEPYKTATLIAPEGASMKLINFLKDVAKQNDVFLTVRPTK